MLKSNGGEEDVFFDSIESFRSGDSLSIEESVIGVTELEYQIWERDLVSVSERRERFLQGMGFGEFVPPQSGSQEINEDMSSSVSLSNTTGLERIAQSSGAVSSSSCSCNLIDEGITSCSGRDLGQHRSGRQRTAHEAKNPIESLPNTQQRMQRESTAHGEEHAEEVITLSKKKLKSWWNRFVQKRMKEGMHKQSASVKPDRMKVRHNRKRCMEFTAVYMGQQIHAHKGFILTMKFSPDGQYLASGGEDGVVRIWRVTSTVASSNYFTPREERGNKLIPGRKQPKPASVIIPQKVFKIDESPLQEFYGHTDDVLDLCWSKSNCLLSSSKDETVRLWKVGSDECLQVFHHNNYVTCIQFNPIDDGYFISGSIDGKVRVWGVSESRVVDWADVRDIITAICYQPDGQGFIVGSISGQCRFYDASGNQLQLDAQIYIQGRKKSSSSNRITGFQFSPEDAQKVMITSADSKVRIFDGLDVIHKYRGLRKSGSQMSGSFTSNGRHIISVGEDSRVYVWNYDDGLSSKQAKSTRSCEHFFFEGVSVAIPWLGMENVGTDSSLESSTLMTSSIPSARFSFGGWFSMDSRLRGLATWPEEKLPLWSVPVEEEDEGSHNNRASAFSSTWGLVIVTGGCDGVITTFQNYGLPVRL